MITRLKSTDDFIMALSNRLHAASSVLSKVAEKDGAVMEVLRLRQALMLIADAPGDEDSLRLIAAKALGWIEEM